MGIIPRFCCLCELLSGLYVCTRKNLKALWARTVLPHTLEGFSMEGPSVLKINCKVTRTLIVANLLQ